MKIQKTKVNEGFITEAGETVADLEKEVEDTSEVVDDSGDIEQALDKCLRVAKRQKKHSGGEYVNALLVGEAGSGKTARVKEWAKKNNINLFSIKANSIDETDLGGALAPDLTQKKAVPLRTSKFDNLNRPNSVLFLDELNRARPEVIGGLLSLINDHEIEDPNEDGNTRILENFLFTVAAINPDTYGSNTDELDPALMDRFRVTEVAASKARTLDFLRRTYTAQLAEEDDESEIAGIQGRLAIAEKILTNNKFHFDSATDRENAVPNTFGVKITSPRSFSKALESCDGTKDDFISEFQHLCNPKGLGIIEDILEDYVDVEDKATAAIKGATADGLAKKKVSIGDKVARARGLR